MEIEDAGSEQIVYRIGLYCNSKTDYEACRRNIMRVLVEGEQRAELSMDLSMKNLICRRQ